MESFVRMAGVFVGCFLALAGIGFMLRVPIRLGLEPYPERSGSLWFGSALG